MSWSWNQNMMDKLSSLKVDLSKLTALGGDSTALNTGWEHGAFTRIERKIGRRLNWNVCLIHILELPTKKILKRLDGDSLSGDKWSGPIGKLLPEVESLPINPNFPVLDSFLVPAISSEALSQLNADQKMLAKLVIIITTGVIPPNFSKYTIGKVRLKNMDY